MKIQTLEQQVNQAYEKRKAAEERLRELRNWDYSRMESCQIRSIENSKQKAVDDIADADMQISQLALVIQARLADYAPIKARRGKQSE